MAHLEVLSAGPGLSLRDGGRHGGRAHGLPPGGAMDPVALLEAAVLLGLPARPLPAAIELGPGGASVAFAADHRVALTGAPRPAAVDGRPVAWGGAHAIPAGATLTLGAPRSAMWSYLVPAGGLEVPRAFGSVAPLAGTPPAAGDRLRLGADAGGPSGRVLPMGDRFGGGAVRMVEGPQTALFPEKLQRRLRAIEYRAGARSNRQAVQLEHGEGDVSPELGTGVLSEAAIPGDVQVTPEGRVFVLMPDGQTTAGYPRLGTVVPQDLPRLAQALPGMPIRLVATDRDAARAGLRADDPAAALRAQLAPILRPASEDPTLLGRQLISGVTAGRPDPDEDLRT